MSHDSVVQESVATRYGFRFGDRGTQTSRTTMLAEIKALLANTPVYCTKADYLTAIVSDNVLGKRTESTRRLTAKRLREIYALDSNILLFRTLRQVWDADVAGQPMLACLCANARDPLLRITSAAILPVSLGGGVSAGDIARVVAMEAPGRFNEDTLQKIGRNAASSWTQSGHLRGRVHKIRVKPVVTAESMAYALLLGYLAGARGVLLFDTHWVRLLDLTTTEVDAFAFEASRRGLIDYRRLGTVVDISFSGLLSPQDLEAIRGQD